MILKLLLFQATACLPSLVDKENREPLAVRLKESRRDPEKVAKDPGKVQLSQREPSREESKAPRILRRYIVDIIGIDVISILLQDPMTLPALNPAGKIYHKATLIPSYADH